MEENCLIDSEIFSGQVTDAAVHVMQETLESEDTEEKCRAAIMNIISQLIEINMLSRDMEVARDIVMKSREDYRKCLHKDS